MMPTSEHFSAILTKVSHEADIGCYKRQEGRGPYSNTGTPEQSLIQDSYSRRLFQKTGVFRTRLCRHAMMARIPLPDLKAGYAVCQGLWLCSVAAPPHIPWPLPPELSVMSPLFSGLICRSLNRRDLSAGRGDCCCHGCGRCCWACCCWLKIGFDLMLTVTSESSTAMGATGLAGSGAVNCKAKHVPTCECNGLWLSALTWKELPLLL
jgi:hypothetical protein